MILDDMPFVEDAKNYVQKLVPSCAERFILEFLLQHGVGIITPKFGLQSKVIFANTGTPFDSRPSNRGF